MNIIEVFNMWDETKHEYLINKNYKDAKYIIQNGGIFRINFKNNIVETQCYISKNFLDDWTIVKKKIMKEGWINIYKIGSFVESSTIYKTFEDANKGRAGDTTATVKVSWEE